MKRLDLLTWGLLSGVHCISGVYCIKSWLANMQHDFLSCFIHSFLSYFTFSLCFFLISPFGGFSRPICWPLWFEWWFCCWAAPATETDRRRSKWSSSSWCSRSGKPCAASKPWVGCRWCCRTCGIYIYTGCLKLAGKLQKSGSNGVHCKVFKQYRGFRKYVPD